MTPAPIWVFVGPSLPERLRPDWPGYEWRPPAVAGDGIAARAARPAAVVLIDGLFDARPAIRHQELLALMDDGIPVVGGGSMGALRAAELYPLGMAGAGRIFQGYASGLLIGDDEVALLHGPAEMDWTPLTLPMVNVRATLCAAARSGVVSPAVARRIRAVASRIFFQDRTWRTMEAALVADGGLDEADCERFCRWAPGGYVDLKRADALACLDAARAYEGRAPAATRPLPQTCFTAVLAQQVRSGAWQRPAA